MAQDASVRQQQREQGASFHQFAEADATIPLGRFTQVNAATVIGSTALPQYPAAAAHQRDPVPKEEPLGYRIDDLNPSDPVELSSFTQQETPNPASAVAPSASLDVEQRGAGLDPLSRRAFRRF
jgi:hypothetical protein